MRHVLEMVVHLVLHVEDDALGDPGVDIALEHRDHLGGRQRDEGHDEQLHEQAHVLAHERLVDDPSGDDARQQADHGREQDRHEHQQELQRVGLEIAEDPPQQRAGDLRHVLFLFLGQKTAGAEPPPGSGHKQFSFLCAFFLILFPENRAVNGFSCQRRTVRTIGLYPAERRLKLSPLPLYNEKRQRRPCAHPPAAVK